MFSAFLSDFPSCTAPFVAFFRIIPHFAENVNRPAHNCYSFKAVSHRGRVFDSACTIVFLSVAGDFSTAASPSLEMTKYMSGFIRSIPLIRHSDH